jgi:hypothetical protein
LESRDNMKRFGLLFLLVAVIGINQCVAASHYWNHQVGNWAEPNKWSGEGMPNGNSEVLIRYADSRCILDSNAGDWPVAQRLRVYGQANLEIVDGASLLGISWMRAGTSEGPACVKQTGGLVRLKGGRDNSKLTIGYEDGSQGSKYIISGGTITFLDADAYLIVGYRGGEGTLTVIGTDPKIEMRKLYVGGDLVEKAGAGNLEFKIASDGVSPVRLSDSIHIDREGEASTANLIVNAIAEPPKADIVLVEDKGYGGIEGSFDMITDARGTRAATEGTNVVLKHGDTEYHYKLTYRYDASKDGNTNDIGLVYKSEPIVTKQ